MSVVARMFAELPVGTLACLRIAGDERSFPFRPLGVGQHRIGSSPSCEIRLGEQGVPDVHSVIRLGNATAEITSTCSMPPLLRNGEPCSAAILQHGDLIEVGEFRAVFLPVRSEAAAEQSPGRSGAALSGQGGVVSEEERLHVVGMCREEAVASQLGVPTRLLDELLKLRRRQSASLRLPDAYEDEQKLNRPA